MVRGMSDEMERQRDRNQWHLAMSKRFSYIAQLELYGVRLPKKKAHCMRLVELEKLIEEHKPNEL